MCAGTSLLWFISGQAWLSEGMEGDLLGVTSTGEAEYTTSAADSGTSVHEKIRHGSDSFTATKRDLRLGVINKMQNDNTQSKTKDVVLNSTTGFLRPERERERASVHLLNHPGQSALALGSQAASRGGRSRSSWPQPDGRQHRTHPGSALRLYQSLTAPFKHK